MELDSDRLINLKQAISVQVGCGGGVRIFPRRNCVPVVGMLGPVAGDHLVVPVIPEDTDHYLNSDPQH